MERPTTIEDLERRAARARTAAAIAAGLVLLAILLLIFYQQPGLGTGPGDVDIPPALQDRIHKLALPAGEPHIAGGRIAAFQSLVAWVVAAASIASIGALLFGLAKRRKRVAKWG